MIGKKLESKIILHGKSTERYNFFCYNFDTLLNSSAKRKEKNMFFVAKIDKEKQVFDKVVYFGLTDIVSSIQENEIILSKINYDFENHVYYVYDEFDTNNIENKYYDILSKNNFNAELK